MHAGAVTAEVRDEGRENAERSEDRAAIRVGLALQGSEVHGKSGQEMSITMSEALSDLDLGIDKFAFSSTADESADFAGTKALLVLLMMELMSSV